MSIRKSPIRSLLAVAPLSIIGLIPALAAVSNAQVQVEVTPSNMNGWALNTFDDNGAIVTGTMGPYDGTAAMATGPATPPLGVGSAHLATPVNAGDGAAAIATDNYDGTLLSTVTALSYSSYDVTNNGSQFPYLAISINTGAVDTTGNGNAGQIDTLFFEPPYQQGSSDGNGSLPTQEATSQNTWQNWNAYVGGFWDNGFGTPGHPENVGTPGTGVESLSAFETAYPDATIANGGFAGLGGIAMQVGFGSSGETEDGYVDNFTIGVAGVDTTYDFEPNSVPEPASAGLLLVGGATALLRRRRRSNTNLSETL